MALATIQAVCNTLVMLPMRTQFFLEIIGIGELCNILELIYTDDDFNSFLLGNLLGKVENFIWIALYILPIEVY